MLAHVGPNSSLERPGRRGRSSQTVAAGRSTQALGATLKYDDASWHSGGKFPKGLPETAGGTHTGMFVAWGFLSGLAGPIHIEDLPEDIPKLKGRVLTPGQFFLDDCDGKFTDEDLTDEGNAFAAHY